jgi:hypothetical protein
LCVASDSVALDPDNPNAGTASVGPGNTGGSAASGGSSDGLSKNDSSGCALGAGTSHGALGMLGLLISTAVLRRRWRR